VIDQELLLQAIKYSEDISVIVFIWLVSTKHVRRHRTLDVNCVRHPCSSDHHITKPDLLCTLQSKVLLQLLPSHKHRWLCHITCRKLRSTRKDALAHSFLVLRDIVHAFQFFYTDKSIVLHGFRTEYTPARLAKSRIKITNRAICWQPSFPVSKAHLGYPTVHVQSS
jgi:hypothetical protein